MNGEWQSLRRTRCVYCSPNTKDAGIAKGDEKQRKIIMMVSLLDCIWLCYRYGRWVTRRVAVLTIVTIWLLAALVSFVPISFSLHRPDQPLVFEDNGRQYLTCALDLTPTYAVVSSSISFYVPCIVMIGIYCRYATHQNRLTLAHIDTHTHT